MSLEYQLLLVYLEKAKTEKELDEFYNTMRKYYIENFDKEILQTNNFVNFLRLIVIAGMKYESAYNKFLFWAYEYFSRYYDLYGGESNDSPDFFNKLLKGLNIPFVVDYRKNNIYGTGGIISQTKRVIELFSIEGNYPRNFKIYLNFKKLGKFPDKSSLINYLEATKENTTTLVEEMISYFKSGKSNIFYGSYESKLNTKIKLLWGI